MHSTCVCWDMLRIRLMQIQGSYNLQGIIRLLEIMNALQGHPILPKVHVRTLQSPRFCRVTRDINPGFSESFVPLNYIRSALSPPRVAPFQPGLSSASALVPKASDHSTHCPTPFQGLVGILQILVRETGCCPSCTAR